MTVHYRQETLSASEESSHWLPLPGSSLFCNPAEVVHWQQNIPLPLSPPPTEWDMMTQCSQTSSPQEWTMASMPEKGQYQQPIHGSWRDSGAPVTAQGIAALNTATVLTAPPSTVGLGSSPVLSHESQSLDTLTSFSEPDNYLLPPASDSPFALDQAWSPVMYNASDVPTPMQGFGANLFPDQSPYSYSCSMDPAPAVLHGPMFYPQGGQVRFQKRTVSHPSTAPGRPILPRTEGSTVSSQSIRVKQQAESAQMSASHGPQHTVSRVSNLAGQPADVTPHGVASTYIQRNTTGPSQYASHGHLYPAQSAVSVTPNPVSYGQTGYGASASFFPDPTDEDFGALISYDHEEHTGSMGELSFTSGFGVQSPVPYGVPTDVKPMVSVPPQDLKRVSQGSSVATSLASESDEGRHRNHPHYQASPGPDGLYHCPLKGVDPNCQHKPTKLKCNYDKFIDSHVKPFRCKVESCAKQEFSSTACLLRHEREAHGMHGHGDRPHLCRYTGCERGLPGNGFPRRYNLYDHMKRVHDHKEDPVEDDIPVMGADGHKRAGPRKRKASASPPAPTAQRPKAMPLVPQHAQAMYYPPSGYMPQSVYDASQWTNQGTFVAKQMDMIQGQNTELRRHSAHAPRR